MEQEAADESFAASADAEYSQYNAEEYAAYADATGDGAESEVYPYADDAAGNQEAVHLDGQLEGYDAAAAGYEWDGAYGEEEYTAYAEEDPTYDEYDVYAEQEQADPFDNEAYWQQEQYNIADDAAEEENAREAENPEIDAGDYQAQTVQEPSHAPESAAAAGKAGSRPTSPKKQKKASHKKTKQERMQLRQEQLEREEEAKAQLNEVAPSTASPSNAKGQQQQQAASVARKAPRPGFIAREKAKIQLHMRKVKAMSRKRMPVQVRVLTEPRRHLSPMEKYFNHSSIEWVLSDVFWAAMKGDLRRVRHLVEIEQVDVNDATLDPWNMQQSPLHWAAKGGSAPVIEYLLQSGANARSLDENGSYPLHLACWAGHIDATLTILRATDTKDLYVRDYDAALAPLDWVNIRGHAALLAAIQKYEDAIWLPKFVEDLIRGIIRYKIKVFKEPPKPARRALFKPGGTATATDNGATPAATTSTNDQNPPVEGAQTDAVASLTKPSDAKELPKNSPKKPKK